MLRIGVLICCSLLAVLALAAAPPNLLPNGDIENGLTGWTANGVVATDAGAYQGRQALLLSAPVKGGAGVTSAVAPVEGGHDYLLSLRYRSEGFSRKGGFDGVNASGSLYFFDANNKQIGAVSFGLSYDPQPKWLLVLRLCAAPAGAVSARFQVSMGVQETGLPSKLWLDQVQVRAWDGAVKPGGRTWSFNADRYFAQANFRRVADDESATGFSVIGNTRFQKTPGYLVGGLYLGQSGKGLPPGTYRVLFRLRVGDLPNPPAPVVSLDVNPQRGGCNNARTVMSDEFKQGGVYQDVPLRLVVSPDCGYVDFRAYWHGTVTTWADTFTIVEEEIYTDAQLPALFN
jgi:hypothetical protein